MNKFDLIKIVSAETGMTKLSVEVALNTALTVIRDTVSGGQDVGLSGFGSFKSVERRPRVGFNPKTRQKLSIPAQKRPTFTPSKEFKGAVNQ